MIPGRQLSAWGVSNVPFLTTKTLVAFVSDTKPFRSSMSASSTPARLASIFAKMLLIKLLWWIFESMHCGLLRRIEEGDQPNPGLVVHQRFPFG